MAKQLKQVKVTNVRISSEKPAATVKFKDVSKPKSDTKRFRATCRGEAPIFVVGQNGTWKAGVRGDSPVGAKTADQAFQRAVKQHWA
jgi:hypothetical protein